jgi:hypothetical protein
VKTKRWMKVPYLNIFEQIVSINETSKKHLLPKGCSFSNVAKWTPKKSYVYFNNGET